MEKHASSSKDPASECLVQERVDHANDPTTATHARIEYPSGDGKPMAETEIHLRDMIETIEVLDDYFAEEPNVYVCGNLLLYYEEGNPRKNPLLA